MYSRNTARYDNYEYYRYENSYYNTATLPLKPVKEKRIQRPLPKPKKKRKTSLAKELFALTFLAGVGYCFLPYAYHCFNANFVSNPFNTVSAYNNVANKEYSPSTGINYHEFINPTLSYLTNYTFNNEHISYNAIGNKHSQMTNIQYGVRLSALENQILALNKKYPMLKPSVFVYSIDNRSFVKINSDRVMSAASIIKLPVLIQLYKSIEAEQFGLGDSMYLTEYYRSPGSGDMQYSQVGNKYSISDLAKVMIQDSDNTATNMLISKVGSMNDINAALKNWGIQHTHVHTWLPDLTGTNYTTAEDIAKMLYNISDDNNSFLNVNSQSDIINIMGKVKNTGLIKAGLPENTNFIHKTGDIGSMLGDAGIVYTPTNERYIVVIMTERPHNSYHAKLYIQEASKLIYNYMTR